jgi:cell division protein FtsB
VPAPRQPDPSSRSARDRRRRTTGTGAARGGSGPGRGATATRPARRPAARPVGRTAPTPAAPRPRLTGRAAILVLVLAVLAVSYASSLRAYLHQRTQIDALQSTITQRQAEIDQLEDEKERWLDPEYVETEARERLGYVMPGETPFVALRDGAPLEAESDLTDPATIAPDVPRAFWEDAWDTMLVAGDPQRRADPPPLTRVREPEEASE